MCESLWIPDHLTRDPRGFWVAVPDRHVSYPDGYHDFHYPLEDQSFWYRHRNRIILEAVRAFPPTGGPIADVGGGNGYVARGLERAGFLTVMIEPGLTGVLNACRRGVRHVICSTVEDAGLRDGCLGGVGLFDVLEHLEDPTRFLEMLRGKLAASGRVYATVPAFDTLWSAEDDRSGHFRRYTLRSLAKVFAQAGLRVEYATYFFWFLPFPVFLVRSVPTSLGLRRSFTPSLFRREYMPCGERLGRVVDRLLAAEVGMVSREGRIPFGSSCLVVARRPAPEDGSRLWNGEETRSRRSVDMVSYRNGGRTRRYDGSQAS